MEQEIASLYEKLNTELIRWCCIMTQDEDMAREIVQEGFLRAIDHFGDIRDLEFPQQRAWFYRTVKNIFVDTMRKRKNEYLTDDVAEGISFDRYSEKEIMCLIETMDKLEGKILVLRHVEGFSSKQIGEMLGLPSGTVRSKLHDARNHLREML
ncbi:MAG: RNA polymerase sigma factor [Butyrivibrio sp.]|nr:RNA polymerase sigma factor [Butyrivibrio sp.]